MADSSNVANADLALMAVCHDALQEEYRQVVACAVEHIRVPAPGGPYCRERDALISRRHPSAPARREIWFQTVAVSELILANLTDHVLAMSTLLTSSSLPLYSPGSLARVAFEAGLRLRYLLDYRADLDTRLLRGAATLLHGAREDVRAVSEMRPGIQALPRGKKMLERKQQDLRKIVQAAGIIEITKPPRVEWPDGRSEPLALNMTDQAREFGKFPAFYRFTSGIAHSAEWMLDDLAEAKHGMQRLAPNPFKLGGFVDATLGVCASATEVHARFYGQDFYAAYRDTEARREAVYAAMLQLAPRQPTR